MPNLMVGFLNDITHVSKTAGDVTSIVTASVEIQREVMGGFRSVKDTAKKLKSGQTLRALSAWFNQKETYGEDTEFAASDDDFDAGFGSNLDEDEPSSAPLSSSDMTDLGKGQVREMYRVSGETYEAKLHTTAEIINSLNQRSSEVLASMHTTQSYLKRMNDALDKIVSIRQSKLAAREKRVSIFNDSGEITLGSVFNSLKAQMSSSRKSLIKSVMDKTGLTALDEMSHTAITNMSNTVFSKLLSMDVFKKIFGDQTRMHGPTDYSAYVETNYTKEAALFDGQVRKTIVDIIPGYLKVITHSLTGTTYHISDYGSLTTETPLDHFDRTIDTTFETKLNQTYTDKIVEAAQDDGGDAGTIYKLQSVLVSQYVFYLYKNGIQVLKEDELTNGGIKSIHQHVGILFSNQTNTRYSRWVKLLSYIEARMVGDKQYRRSFIRSVNAGFQRLDALAKSVVNSRNVQTTQYTRDMFDQHARDLIGYDAKFAQYEGKTPRQLLRDGLVKEEDLPDKYLRNLDQKINSLDEFHAEIMKSSYDSSGMLLNDVLRMKQAYLNGIFDRLNVGINVFVVPWKYKDEEAEFIPTINTQAMPVAYPTSTATVYVPAPAPIQSTPTPSQPNPVIEAVKNNRVVNSISNALSNEWGRMKGDALMFRDQMFDAFGDRLDMAILENDVDRLAGLNTEQGTKDAETIKAVMTAMQTASADGDTQEDLSSLKDVVSEIEDPEARERVNKLIQNTLERSGKKTKAKSILGKAVLLVFGAFKKAINFARKTVGKMLGKYLKWVTKMFKSAGKNIVTGGKAFAQGLFGKKDSDQKGLIRDTIAWGKKVWHSNAMQNLRDAGGYIGNTVKTVGSLAVDKMKDVGTAIADKAKPILSKVGNTAIKAAGTVGGYALIAKDNITEKADKLKKAFAKTSFGKGFMSVFEDKEAPKITATSLFDHRSTDISNLVKESPTGTFFGTMIAVVKEYTESLTDYVDYISGEGDEEENRRKVQEQQQKRAEEQRKKKEEEERKKKEEEERKKRAAEEAAKKKAEAKSPLGFDLGKMMGGLTKILQGIFKSVTTIIQSMTGLMAILEIGDQILKKSLKPLNKVFFQIRDMLKPIIQIITKTLKAVAEAIFEIVNSVVKLIQPLLEAIEPIIESLLEALMPILDIITSLVNILLVPLTAVMKVTVIPILRGINNGMQMLLGILQVGFGIMLTALSGWLIALGTILKFVTVGFAGDEMKETGKQLFSTGTSMVVSGAKSYVSGIKGQLTLIKDNALTMITLGQYSADDDEDEKDTKTSKKKSTALHGSALEGTYGSGDEDALYELSAPLKEAMDSMRGTGKKFLNMFMPEDEDEDITNGALKELQKLTQRITGIFTGEEDDTVSERLEKESNKLNEENLKFTAADLTDEENAQIESVAFENFQKDHPQKDNETNEEYRKRYEKSYKKKYVNAAMAAYLKEKNEKALNGEDGGVTSIINSTTGDEGMISKFQSGMTQVDDSVKTGGFADIAVPLDGSSSSSSSRSSGSNQGEIRMTGQLAKGNIWDAHKNKSGVKKFMQTALNAGLTGAQLATVASTGIWEDGGEKLWGSKSLTATTYDVNGQRAQGIMNWVDPNVDYGDTVEEQLQYIQRTYFSPSTNDSRAKVQKNSYWDTDEKAFAQATGRSGFELSPGEKYGPAMESDLIEGSEHFFRTALVPACIHTVEGPRKYIGTAVGVYNWLLDEGYIDSGDYDEGTTSTSSGAKLTGNSTEEKIYKYLTTHKNMSGVGAAGMMGCMKYESGMKPNNLEDAYNSQFGISDEAYTAAVDNKQESKKNFMYGRYATYISGQTPGEAVGYGLTQFTSSALKKDLYEATVEHGKSIADIGAQLDAVVDTLKQRKVGSKSLFDTIKSSPNPTKANQWFLWRYEAGTGYNSDEAVARAYSWMGMKGINDRHSAAEQYYDMYGSGTDDIYLDTDDYPASYVEAVQDTLLSQADQQDYIFDGIEEADIEPLVGDEAYIPPMIDQSTLQPGIQIPALTPTFTTQSSPIVINQYLAEEFNLSDYVDSVLGHEYDVEASRIQELVDGIFEELPEYLEDDDDDEFTDEDDLVIQQLAAAFL